MIFKSTQRDPIILVISVSFSDPICYFMPVPALNLANAALIFKDLVGVVFVYSFFQQSTWQAKQNNGIFSGFMASCMYHLIGVS